MTMGFAGLDVEAIRHLARQLDIQSNEVRAASRELNQLVRSTEWFGADQRRFMSDWETTKLPALNRAATLLADASQIASQGAVEQERVSRS